MTRTSEKSGNTTGASHRRRAVLRRSSCTFATVALLVMAVGQACSADRLHAPGAAAGSHERGCDHYASPSDGGDQQAVRGAMTIAEFWKVAAPGKTLCLLDGTYRGIESMISPPPNLNGAAGEPITVRALHDGRVTIDGEGVRRPVFLNHNDYFVLEGFNASRSSETVVRVLRSNHTVVRRVAAWDAADGNNTIFFTSSSEDTLFEDVAAWGIARKVFAGSQGGNRLTCRRCWGRWEGSHVVGPKMTYSLAYNSYGMLVENSIGTWSGERMKETYTLLDYYGQPWTGRGRGTLTGYAVDQPMGIFSIDGFSSGVRKAGARVLGSLAYITAQDRFPPGSLFYFTANDGITIERSVGYVPPGAHEGKRAFDLHGPGQPVETASLVARSLLGISRTASIVSPEWQRADVVDAPTVSTAANVYETHICTRYRDGILTQEPLWPWPMNQRILEATVESGRAPVDVTRTVEEMFGPIPRRCRK